MVVIVRDKVSGLPRDRSVHKTVQLSNNRTCSVYNYCIRLLTRGRAQWWTVWNNMKWSTSSGTTLSSVLRPCQHSIGYMGDVFYTSKDPTNSTKVLKEKATKENTGNANNKIHTYIHSNTQW